LLSSFHRRVEDAVDLHDIVIEQALHLDHGPRRIGWSAPQLGLRPFYHRRKAREVAEIDCEPYAILEARALRFCDCFDVEKGLANSRLGVFHELVGGWIDALHTSNEDKVPCSCAEAPSANRLDCAWRIERPYAVGRVRVRRDKTCRERNCTCRKRNSRS